MLIQLKPPPPSVFGKWAKAKGIKPRDKKTGKFITAKQFGFIMSQGIYFQKGRNLQSFLVYLLSNNLRNYQAK